MRKWLTLLALAAALSAGCANQTDHHRHMEAMAEEETPPATVEPTSTSEQAAAQTPAPDETEYTLDVAVNDQYELLVETNLKLSVENYNKSHSPGEGHIHLYINGRLVGPIQTTDPYSIEKHLKDGENKIKLALTSNNHGESYYKVSRELVVEKK